MSDVSMQPNVQTVVPKYTPEEAMEIRKELAENLKEQAQKKGINPPVNIDFVPELSGNITNSPMLGKTNGLERSPNQDEYSANNEKLLCASISPKEAVEGISSVTAVLVALKGLVNAGFDLNDLFKDRFGNNTEKTPQQKNNITPQSTLNKVA